MLRVLILALETGGGHVAPALAVKEALERLFPGRFSVEVSELAVQSGAARADLHVKGVWDFALAHPWSARLGYVLIERLRPLVKCYLPVMLPDLIEAGSAFIAANPPAAVLSTHYLCTDVARRARRARGLSYPVLQFVTDPWDAYYWWAVGGGDVQCVCSARARDMLVERGVPPERIRVVPFPVARRFLVPGRGADQIRAELGLCPERRTVLFTLGAQGIGGALSWAEEIHRRGLCCNLLCVAGRNRSALSRLRTLATQASPTRLVPLGFVGNMHELMSVADLVVGKAGSSTTLEALATGTPILFLEWVAQNERPNVDFCLRHGAAWYAPDRSRFFPLLGRLLVSDELEQARQRIEALDLPLGADRLARLVAEAAARGHLPSADRAVAPADPRQAESSEDART